MLEFAKISEYPRGTLYAQLKDAYSFSSECIKQWDASWREYDQFFYDHLDIADQCGFITVLDGRPIGHISWDPRNNPRYVILGHNCIITKEKGNGYGKRQLTEAVRRIRESGAAKIMVTTNELFYAAQKNYESIGMEKVCVRKNEELPFLGNEIEYQWIV